MTKAKEFKMNPRTRRKMDKINQRLKDYKQTTRLVELSSSSLVLNTGQKFCGSYANKFIKRIMNTKVVEWVKNTDLLLSGAVDESEIKRMSSAIGGKACQEKHGEKIKNNLNTGTPWNKGTKGQNIGSLGPRTDEVKRKISLKNKGSNNGRYGYKYSNQEKLKQSRTMKKLILSGRFTPQSNNRNTHWDAYYNGKKYRSSWEALYQYINHNAEYEKLRLEYTYNNISSIYIVDFIDHVNKVAVEVKPLELCVGSKFKAKIQALREWATKNSYEVLIADQYWLKNQLTEVDYGMFDEKTALKIRKLYETSKTHRN